MDRRRTMAVKDVLDIEIIFKDIKARVTVQIPPHLQTVAGDPPHPVAVVLQLDPVFVRGIDAQEEVVALILEEGKGVAKDTAKARAYYEQACNSNYEVACKYLNEL